MAERSEGKSKRVWISPRTRAWLRTLHRDIGYASVGLTLVYALSGLAVNHIKDWDPNFENFERSFSLTGDLPDDDQQAAVLVQKQLGLQGEVTGVFRYEGELEFQVGQHEILVNEKDKTILDRGREARPLLRVMNWLHLQRGKPAWNYIADSYAIFLVFLALSGLVMLPGRKGILGRGGLFVILGIAAPVLYVVLSGGPNSESAEIDQESP